MKKWIAFLMVLGSASSALAGDWQYSCATADRLLIFTRTHLVNIRAGGRANADAVDVLKNQDVSQTITSGTVLVFTAPFSSVRVKVDKILSDTKIYSENESGPCGAGKVVRRLIIDATVEGLAVDKSKERFICKEMFTWSGRAGTDCPIAW